MAFLLDMFLKIEKEHLERVISAQASQNYLENCLKNVSSNPSFLKYSQTAQVSHEKQKVSKIHRFHL